jgi:hypothetical protein
MQAGTRTGGSWRDPVAYLPATQRCLPLGLLALASGFVVVVLVAGGHLQASDCISWTPAQCLFHIEDISC